MKKMGVSLLGIMLVFTSISYAKACQPGEAEQLIKQGWSFPDVSAYCKNQIPLSQLGPGTGGGLGRASSDDSS